MDSKRLDEIVEAVVRELLLSGSGALPKVNPTPSFNLEMSSGAPLLTTTPNVSNSQTSALNADLQIDLEDPARDEVRTNPGVDHPADPEGLQALIEATPARIGQGRAGPRYRTAPWLLFQADQAITQDTLFREVDEKLLSSQGLFKVGTCITGGKQEFLLRPDLGRKLNDEARRTILEKCVHQPDIQVCIGDGLSAQAIESNLPQILPVIRQGCQTAGLNVGTPFFIQYCRVGVMNDIGDLLHPRVLMLLIGERPGLGRADSMSIYMAFKPQKDHTDAERDVICNIYNGGTNPLEAGAYAVQLAQKMIRFQAAGVKLKLAER